MAEGVEAMKYKAGQTVYRVKGVGKRGANIESGVVNIQSHVIRGPWILTYGVGGWFPSRVEALAHCLSAKRASEERAKKSLHTLEWHIRALVNAIEKEPKP